MRILCLDQFREAIRKLSKNKSYHDIEEVIGSYFFDKSPSELNNGVRLLNSPDHQPYIKKRLNGKGGYRVYFLIIQKDEDFYLIAIHPKTGSFGQESLTLKEIRENQDMALDAIQKKSVWEIGYESVSKKLVYKPIPKEDGPSKANSPSPQKKK